jgi:hypothetical protein
VARSKVKPKAKTKAKAKAKAKAKPVTKARTVSRAGSKGGVKRATAKRKTGKSSTAKRSPARKAAPKRTVASGKRATAQKPTAGKSASSRPLSASATKPRVQGRRILDLAQVIRSKNAGPFEVTFDIMFDSAKNYRMVRDSGVITRKLIARLYGISDNAVLVCRPYDPAQAIKITIRRPVSSGDIGDSDVYGCQQHVPLTAISVPV